MYNPSSMMHISWHLVFVIKSYVRLVEINAGCLGETTAASGYPGLRHDLGIRGVWQPQV